MITTTNYFNEVQKIGVNTLPEPFKKSHALIEKVTNNGNTWDVYSGNDNIKRMIDLYIVKLNDYQGKNEPQKPKKVAAKKEKKYVYDGQTYTEQGIIEHANTTLHYEIEDNDMQPFTNADDALKALKQADKAPKAKKASKSKTPASNVDSNAVERISDDVSVIKRMVAWHGKKKTKAQVIALTKSIQKAILEKKISKKSLYGTEVMELQNFLLRLSKDRSEIFDIQLTDNRKEHYLAIALSEHPMVSVSLLKRFVGLVGKIDIEDRVKNLLKAYQRAFDNKLYTNQDKYISEIDNTFEALKNYRKGTALTYPAQQLNGLGNIFAFASSAIAASYLQSHLQKGIEKIFPNKKPATAQAVNEGIKGLGNPSEVMSVETAKAQEFETIGFTGELKNLIGDACAPTSMFIYGNGGSGKSGLSLKISDFLNKRGYSVLYIAGEQFNTPSFSKLLKATGVTGNSNFKIVKGIQSLPLSEFKVIVIDSKESVGLTNSAQFKELRNQYSDKIFVITSQGTKAGDFAGDEKWRNETECMIYCENGTASTLDDKNRWGGKAKIQLYGKGLVNFD